VAGPDDEFKAKARQLESEYLKSDDPLVQSGFSGGEDRWFAERSPIVEGIDQDGDFLDVGCANGQLARDVMRWAADRGFEVIPHGIDIGPRLIDLARGRLPVFGDNFQVADAWDWEPDRQWAYVYSVLDLAPEEMWCEWIERLMSWVEPGGRLIIGSYRGRTPRREPLDVEEVIRGCGISVGGESVGGEPVVARFAWATHTI
jgi:SAM-dependent methyltransferase